MCPSMAFRLSLCLLLPPLASSPSLSSPPLPCCPLHQNATLDIHQRMNRFYVLFLLCLALALFPFSARAWTGSVVSVSDGDTVTVAVDRKGETALVVRLYGIDAPEVEQPHGAESAAALRALLPVGARVDILPFSEDRYGRAVALVRHKGNVVNGAMVKDGHAWVYPRYCRAARFCRTWKKAQKEAQAAARGLWRDENPVPPWIWRKTK